MMDLSSLQDADLEAIAKGDMAKVSDAALEHIASGGYSSYGPNELQGPDVKYDRPPSGWSGGKWSNVSPQVLTNPKVMEAQYGWENGVPPLVSLPMGGPVQSVSSLKSAIDGLMEDPVTKKLILTKGAEASEAAGQAFNTAEAPLVDAVSKIKAQLPSYQELPRWAQKGLKLAGKAGLGFLGLEGWKHKEELPGLVGAGILAGQNAYDSGKDAISRRLQK